jgi:putative two-component system hydrogenase maturation factor HypX/HoxX
MYCADGAPGATATLMGEEFHLFGVHQTQEAC